MSVNVVESTVLINGVHTHGAHEPCPEGTTLRALRIEAIRIGFKWADVKVMGKDELWAHLCMNSSLPTLWSVDKDMGLLEKKVQSIRAKREVMRKVFERAEGNPIAQDGLRFLCKGPVDALNWVLNKAPEAQADETLGLLWDSIQEECVARTENKKKKFSTAGARRGTYVPKATLLIAQMKAEGKEHQLNVRWDETLDTKGLIEQILGEYEGRPPVIRIRWELKLRGEQDIEARQELARRLWEIGYLSSQGILAWDMCNERVKFLLNTCFPSGIDLAGYNHRLGAPLLPEGFLSGVNVRFWTPTVNGVTQECDGSGVYDPEHVDMKPLVERYGAVPMQFTFVTRLGLFAKGIIVPREGINIGIDNPTGIILDPAQVKGSQKGKVSEGEIHKGWVGFMTAWNQDRFYPVGFESLQCLDWKNQDVIKTASAIMERFISNRADVVELQGLEGLLDKAARSDEQVAMVVRLAKTIQAHNPNYNPLSLDMLRDHVNDLLRKFNYILLQGAGAMGAQRICVLDASVPAGKCVVSGFKSGVKLVVWRFPNILPQGNKVLESIPAQPHQMVDGKTTRNTIWLNPADLTLGMQGDDDGDMVGVSDDENLVALFSLPMYGDYNRSVRAQFKIEPVGKKKEMSSLSEKGRVYLALDPMGPVGIATIWQSEFYALGSFKHALVMGVFIQYAIDSAKRLVEWPDPDKLLQPNYWYKKDGAWHIKEEASLGLEPGAPFPYELMKDWTAAQRSKFPECRKGKDQEESVNILSWRIQEDPKSPQKLVKADGTPVLNKLDKKADLKTWIPTIMKRGAFKGEGNAVHQCHDLACKKMKSIEKSFCLDVESTDIRNVLTELASTKGIALTNLCGSWEEYEGSLRKSCGITGFGEAFRKAMANSSSSDDKQARIGEELQKLGVAAQGLTMDEVNTIWYWENTNVWAKAQHRSLESIEGWRLKNRPNYAFRIVSQSKFLQTLGIEEESGCPWMSTDIMGFAKQWFKNHSWDALGKFLFSNTSHGEGTFDKEGNKLTEGVKDEQGNPVPLHKCEWCKNILTTMLLTKERAEKRGYNPDELSIIVKSLKRTKWIIPGKEGMEQELYEEEGEVYYESSEVNEVYYE